MEPLLHFKAFADSIDGRLYYVVLMLIVFGIIYLWRRLWPESFERIPSQWQSLPAILLGAVLSAASDSDSVKHALVAALLGAFSSGFGAIGGHHALKSAPGPYGRDQ